MENEDVIRHQEETLTELVENNPKSISACVIEDALDYHSIESFFTDLLSHGCSSGIVSRLIYYEDTHQFYDDHYEEIEGIRSQIVDMGIELQWPDGDLKNHLAWLAYEETARHIAFNVLELEI